MGINRKKIIRISGCSTVVQPIDQDFKKERSIDQVNRDLPLVVFLDKDRSLHIDKL